MKCPHLKGEKIKQCHAVNCVVVLSGYELKLFCESGEHLSCPVFSAQKNLGKKKLTLTGYCAIYSSWVKKGAESALEDNA